MRKYAAVLFAIVMTGCAARKPVAAVPIPTCPTAQLVPQKGCTARAWGNGVEVDCGEEKPRIYICSTLEHPSPTK